MTSDRTDPHTEAGGFEARNVRRSYDAVAAEYAAAFADELAGKALDGRLLDALATSVPPGAVVLDLGCGPGQVGARLAAAGSTPVGVDLSPGMLALARQRRAAAGDLRALPLRTGGAAAAVAFYCLHHLPPADVVAALTEVRRALRPGAPMLASTHLGEGALHASEWFGHAVDLTGALTSRPAFDAAFAAAGFDLLERHEREPGPEEADTQRYYVLARSTST